MCLTRSVSVLTGGPGTGKTTIIRALVEAASSKVIVRLCAPTGRAARRLAESSGAAAATIHRLLGARGHGQFEYGPDNPLDCGLLIVDESSMLDARLLQRLLAALPERAGVVFVGDADQLPSVGLGACLRDLIAGAVPTARLARVYRQDEGSGIAHGAQHLLVGQVPDFGNGLWYVGEDDPERAAGKLVDLAARADAVQVLSPMRKGPLGVTRLNQLLREQLNPPPSGRTSNEIGGFRAGDRVVQTTNDYDLGVMNGEIGRVLTVNPTERIPQVRFEDRDVDYDALQVSGLEFAFAITIHKAQGAQYPCVLMPLSTQHYVMLTRPLIYTGLTRAERDAVFVGQEKALRLALHRVNDGERRTRLKNLLARS